MEYFHLDFPTSDRLIRSIQTRLRQSSSAKLRERIDLWEPETHGEIALAVVTKVEMLNRIVTRLNNDLTALTEHLKKMPQEVEQCIAEVRALHIPDPDFVWNLLVDTDSFLFEARSAYELLGKFVKVLFELVFERKVREEDIFRELRALRVDVEWARLLQESRIHFFHSAAPWLAVERMPTGEFDLLILKRNAETLTEDDYLHFGECRLILKGLYAALNGIFRWIANEIGAVGQQESKSKP